MKPLYFVTYFYTDKKGNQGWGSAQVEGPQLVATYSDVETMRNAVQERNAFKQCAILNWRRFETLDSVV